MKKLNRRLIFYLYLIYINHKSNYFILFRYLALFFSMYALCLYLKNHSYYSSQKNYK